MTKKKKDERNLKLNIINASKAIRKKLLQLKLRRTDEDELIRKSFKPITENLMDLSTTIKKEIKEPLMVALKQEPLIKKMPEEDKPPREEIVAKHEKTKEGPHTISDLFKNLQPLSKQYITGLQKDVTHEYDTTYGLTYNEEEKVLKLGNHVVKVDNNDIIIDGKNFNGTPGLYELLFMNYPENYNKRDEKLYYDIMQITNLHRRNFNAEEQRRGNRSYKWTEVILPILDQYEKSKSSKGGTGHRNQIGDRLVANVDINYPQYIYWNSENELIERLRLLMSSRAAGNTSHENEIASIIEELREANVIV